MAQRKSSRTGKGITRVIRLSEPPRHLAAAVLEPSNLYHSQSAANNAPYDDIEVLATDCDLATLRSSTQDLLEGIADRKRRQFPLETDSSTQLIKETRRRQGSAYIGGPESYEGEELGENDDTVSGEDVGEADGLNSSPPWRLPTVSHFTPHLWRPLSNAPEHVHTS